MQCPNGCSASMKERKVEKIFYRNGEPIVIANLVVYVCPNCGQESMPLSSARIVENILNGKGRSHLVGLLSNYMKSLPLNNERGTNDHR